MLNVCNNIMYKAQTYTSLFKPGARRPLKIDPVQIVGMRACVCVRARGY